MYTHYILTSSERDAKTKHKVGPGRYTIWIKHWFNLWYIPDLRIHILQKNLKMSQEKQTNERVHISVSQSKYGILLSLSMTEIVARAADSSLLWVQLHQLPA